MSLPDFTMRQLLEAGAHFGHQSHRWNPKMAPYIYGVRNSIHIIDLAQTVPLLHQALKTVSDTVAKGGRVLFVGTKRQAADEIAEAAKRSAQYFVNSRWLGGTLTNWKTISGSIARLRKLDEHARRRRQGPDQEGAPDDVARARQAREGARRHQGHGRRARPRVRHRHQQGGAGDQGGQPPQDPGDRHPRHQLRPRRHHLSRARPTTTPAAPSQLYCDLIARAAIDGISRSQGAAGIDLGAAESADRRGRCPSRRRPKAEPAEATSTDQFELLAAPRGAPDDLAKLTGVGPQIVKKLNEHGVFHYWQLAAMTNEEADQARRRPRFNGRVARDNWAEQARALIAAE